MTNDDLQLDVAAELSWEAEKAAARVYGVTDISNELRVQLLDGSKRDNTEFLAASVPSVFGIQNDIGLTSASDGHDIKAGISDAFRRSARLDADELSVDTTSHGAVILAGAYQ
jgi:osmotically-inducible protein OsmY